MASHHSLQIAAEYESISSPCKNQAQLTSSLSNADRYIAKLRSSKSTLRSISLAGNDITDENIDAFATALLGNRDVTHLSMFYVRGGNTLRGSAFLAASAMSLPSLRTLSWSNIFEGGYAVKMLAKGIRSSKTFNRLLLMDSKLKYSDVALLASALEENTSIETIGLEGCGVTDEGVLPMSKMLKKNQALRTLSLSENGITDIGAEVLLASIFDTDSFNSIWMSNHTITSFSRDGKGMKQFYFVSTVLKNKITRILDINRSGRSQADTGRRKIALHMETNFERSLEKGLDLKLIPRVLSWCGRTASFEVLRNMPELFAS